MSNKFVELQSEDGTKSYKLLFGTHALRLIEDKLGVTVHELPNLMARISVKDVQTMFWAGLENARVRLARGGQVVNGGNPYTEVDAAEIIDDVGGFLPAAKQIASGLQKSMPKKADNAEEGKDADPT